jgi:hypothetical protein
MAHITIPHRAHLYNGLCAVRTGTVFAAIQLHSNHAEEIESNDEASNSAKANTSDTNRQRTHQRTQLRRPIPYCTRRTRTTHAPRRSGRRIPKRALPRHESRHSNRLTDRKKTPTAPQLPQQENHNPKEGNLKRTATDVLQLLLARTRTRQNLPMQPKQVTVTHTTTRILENEGKGQPRQAMTARHPMKNKDYKRQGKVDFKRRRDLRLWDRANAQSDRPAKCQACDCEFEPESKNPSSPGTSSRARVIFLRSLFMTKHDHRVQWCRAACGEIACQAGGEQQNQHDTAQGHRVGWSDLEKQAAQRAGDCDGPT